MSLSRLPRPLLLLGPAGFAPQALCLWLALASEPYRWAALAAGCLYAAVILSFLGGLWWMAALLGGLRSGWIYGAAVAPSLIGWASLLPWIAGWAWPAPSLVVLAATIAATPLVDRDLARRVSLPDGWLRLRAILAMGLGGLTLALGLVGLGAR